MSIQPYDRKLERSVSKMSMDKNRETSRKSLFPRALKNCLVRRRWEHHERIPVGTVLKVTTLNTTLDTVLAVVAVAARAAGGGAGEAADEKVHKAIGVAAAAVGVTIGIGIHRRIDQTWYLLPPCHCGHHMIKTVRVVMETLPTLSINRVVQQ